MSGSEPWALVRMKKANDEAARLKREEELVLRQAAVTSWFAQAEANPGANAKAETAALQGCAFFFYRPVRALAPPISVNRAQSSPSPPHPLHTRPHSMERDLKSASEELVKVRRERLRALYAEDRARWQAQLAARGLVIETTGPAH